MFCIEIKWLTSDKVDGESCRFQLKLILLTGTSVVALSPTHAWEMDGISISLQKPGAPPALLIQDRAHKFIQTALASPSHRGGKVQCTCQAYPFCTTPRQLYLTGCLQNPATPIRNPPPVVIVRALSIESMILGKLGVG